MQPITPQEKADIVNAAECSEYVGLFAIEGVPAAVYTGHHRKGYFWHKVTAGPMKGRTFSDQEFALDREHGNIRRIEPDDIVVEQEAVAA